MNEKRIQQAINFQTEGKLAQAESLYREILASQPGHAAANHNLGIVLLAQGQLKSGIGFIEKIISNDPENPELQGTYHTVGKTLHQANHWEAARPWLNKALAYFPDDLELRSMLDRSRPRGYLEPEIYDPLAGQTLNRYSPRESQSYVYTIDISGTCNLRCPSCPVGNFPAAERSKGFMPVSLFRSILDKIHEEALTDQPQIWLYNWGEPLLHPDIEKIIGMVKESGLSVHLSSNLNTEHGIQPVARANPDELKISLSGFTEETYSFTHRRGNIRLVKANMHALRYYLDKYHSTTNVWVGHHLYKHNYDEQADVARLCEELGFGYHPVQAFFQPLEKVVELLDTGASPVDEPVLGQLLLDPRVSVPNISKHRSRQYDCELRFNQTVINHDGSVALCCSVYDQSNMLGMQFLDHSHKDIESRKYQHPFCSTCRQHGSDYSVTEIMDRVIPADVQ